MTKAQFDHQTTIAPSAVRNVTPIESDVFDAIPAAAEPSPGLACAAAHAYVELITAGRYGEIGALYFLRTRSTCLPMATSITARRR